jgi:predicted Rossmann fold nucleotide-binding protein DprA/Smf involved in DNA uptake
MKKEIFVAPNQLFSPNGEGSNQLISTQQVHLLTDFNQIVEKFQTSENKKADVSGSSTPLPLSTEEKNLTQFVHLYAHKELSTRGTQTGLEFGELLSQLTLLEIKGIIQQSNP